MAILGIDTIAVVVSDPVKAIAWYRDVLGLDVAYIGPPQPSPDPSVEGTPDDPGHWIEIGPGRPRTRIHLCHMGGTTEPGPAGITFITDDIQRDHERLRRAGVEFPMPPEKMEWGEWLGQFVDPDGNVFDLKQPISAREWKALPSTRKRPGPSRVRSAPPAGSSPRRARGPRTKPLRRNARAS